MKYILFALLLCIAQINMVFATVIVWVVYDENDKPLNNYNFVVKNENSSYILCEDKSQSRQNRGGVQKWSLYMKCDLEKKINYPYYIIKDSKVIDTGKFIIPEDENIPLTIWKEEYNNIKVGFYSKQLTLSLFSKEYRKIKDELFNKMYFEQGDWHWESLEEINRNINLINVQFKCNNIKKDLKFINYIVKDINNDIIQSGYSNEIIALEIEKGQKLSIEYKDNKEEHKYIVDGTLKRVRILINDCHKKNSIPTKDYLVNTTSSSSQYLSEVKNTNNWIEDKDGYITVKQTYWTWMSIKDTNEIIIKKPITKPVFSEEKNNWKIITIILLLLTIISVYWVIKKEKKK